MVLLYAELGRLEPWISTVTRNPWAAAFEVLPSPVPAVLDGVEPFGFVDGISQPVLDWEQRRDVDGGRDVARLRQRPGARRGPPGLPERVREVH